MSSWMQFGDEVAEAMAQGRPIVALESCVWAQGLPRPMNYDVAQETCRAVRDAGAVPAIICVLDGVANIGLNDEQLKLLCKRKGISKVGSGDLPAAISKGKSGAATVSCSLVLAEKAGIDVFATGGLGGVHSNWTTHFDVSSDLGQLRQTRCLTVCSGTKAVLDVTTTVEVFEMLGLPLAFYGCDTLPRFFTSGVPVGIGVRVDSPAEVVSIHRTSLECLKCGLLVTNPVPADKAVAAEDIDAHLRAGLKLAEEEHISGKQVTPFLLDFLARATHGATLEANRALLVANASLAAKIACELKA